MRMKLQDAKREGMLQQWREMVYKCRNSGQTVAGWCREQKIPVATYYRRQRLVWEQESRNYPEEVTRQQALQAAPSILPAATIEPVPYFPRNEADEAPPQITLQRGEWRLEIRNGADAQLVRQVLELLG